MYFLEKNLPFGASISCSVFQIFSDSLRHIAEFLTGKTYQITNYLDDFLMIELSEEGCNRMVRTFLKMCEFIGCPVSLDKTEWASTHMIFLGILINGEEQVLCVPEDKKAKAINLLMWTIAKKKVIQRLTGTLNFLGKAIVPGWTFTWGMYSKLVLHDSSDRILKPYHHISLDKESVKDCQTWLEFLQSDQKTVLCRPLIDLDKSVHAHTLHFFSDSSLNKFLGMGAVFGNKWIVGHLLT